jgi:hypothetical protein
MTDVPPKSQRDFERVVWALSIITARKADFLASVQYGLSNTLSAGSSTLAVKDPARQIESRLPKIVGALDWTLFVTVEEAASRTLNAKTSIDDLDKTAIWDAIERELAWPLEEY